jgi:hypothetical protein
MIFLNPQQLDNLTKEVYLLKEVLMNIVVTIIRTLNNITLTIILQLKDKENHINLVMVEVVQEIKDDQIVGAIKDLMIERGVKNKVEAQANQVLAVTEVVEKEDPKEAQAIITKKEITIEEKLRNLTIGAKKVEIKKDQVHLAKIKLLIINMEFNRSRV